MVKPLGFAPGAQRAAPKAQVRSTERLANPGGDRRRAAPGRPNQYLKLEIDKWLYISRFELYDDINHDNHQQALHDPM